MTFLYDELTDVMHIAIEAEAGPCFYVESSSGAILRIEHGTNKLIGLAIPYFFAKLEDGSLTLPEIATTAMPSDFIERLQAGRQTNRPAP